MSVTVKSADRVLQILELLTEDERAQGPSFPFWHNVETKPLDFSRGPRTEARDPIFRDWERFVPTSTFDDRWVDACRSLILIDTLGWPAVMRYHVGDHGVMAPSIDVSVGFHRFRCEEPWLLARSQSPSAHAGIVGGRGDVWSRDGELLATGSCQMLCRPVR